MRILMINYEWPPLGGGGGVAMQAIARELANRHTVHILTSGARGLPPEEIHNNGKLRVFRCNVVLRGAKAVASIPSMLSFYPSGVRQGKSLLRRFGYDIINTWFAIPSGPTGVSIARRGNIPHVLTIIGGDVYDPSKWYSPHRNRILGKVVRSVLAGADGHTAISTDIANRAKEHYDFQRSIEVISLGIQKPSFPATTRESLGLKPDAKYIVGVGRLVRRKNYGALLRAVAKLNLSDVELIILGDGPERQNLVQQAQQFGIAQRVQLRGFVTEVEKFQILSNADVFALPSLHEGFGLVFLEAMHCGLPVIASQGGGQDDFLKEGLTGHQVAADDCEGLENALQRILESDTRTMREFNRSLAREFYVARTAERYEDLFEDTVRRRMDDMTHTTN